MSSITMKDKKDSLKRYEGKNAILDNCLEYCVICVNDIIVMLLNHSNTACSIKFTQKSQAMCFFHQIVSKKKLLENAKSGPRQGLNGIKPVKS